MSVTEIYTHPMTDIGSFDLPLKADEVDGETLELLDPYGHIIVLDQDFEHPNEFALSTVLASARYLGVELQIERSPEDHHIRGAGMAWHMGDSQGVGPKYATDFTFAAATPSTVFDDAAGLLNIGGINEGVLTNTSAIGYTVTDAHFDDLVGVAVREALQSMDCHARVNHVGTLDVCQENRAEVFTMTPTVIAVRKGWGTDPNLTGVHANRMTLRQDASNLAMTARFVNPTTKVVTDTEDLTFPYLDIHGTTLQRVVSFSSLPDGLSSTGTYLTNELQKRGLVYEATIDTEQWSIRGSFAPGDYIGIYSPEDGFVDFSHETPFRGDFIWPMWGRVVEWTWYFTRGMAVYYLPNVGGATSNDLINLTRFVRWEGQSGTFSRLVVKVVVPGTPGC